MARGVPHARKAKGKGKVIHRGGDVARASRGQVIKVKEKVGTMDFSRKKDLDRKLGRSAAAVRCSPWQSRGGLVMSRAGRPGEAQSPLDERKLRMGLRDSEQKKQGEGRGSKKDRFDRMFRRKLRRKKGNTPRTSLLRDANQKQRGISRRASYLMSDRRREA